MLSISLFCERFRQTINLKTWRVICQYVLPAQCVSVFGCLFCPSALYIMIVLLSLIDPRPINALMQLTISQSFTNDSSTESPNK